MNIGYDAAHVYPQSKIYANVNFYLKNKQANDLRYQLFKHQIPKKN